MRSCFRAYQAALSASVSTTWRATFGWPAVVRPALASRLLAIRLASWRLTVRSG